MDPESPTSSEGPGLDLSAFSRLYESLAPSLFAWASLRIHPQYRARLDPEDVVQDVWWRAMDAAAQFDPAKGSFRAWVFRIATNVLTDGYRRLAARGRPADGSGAVREVSLPAEIVAHGTSISKGAARSEAVGRLLEMLANLDRDERTLFAHCALEGLSPQDAAPLLGIGADAAAKRWQRLRDRLRQSPHVRSFFGD